MGGLVDGTTPGYIPVPFTRSSTAVDAPTRRRLPTNSTAAHRHEERSVDTLDT